MVTEYLSEDSILEKSKELWYIVHPDRVPNSSSYYSYYSVYDNQVDVYVEAWQKNFRRYKELKSQLPAGQKHEEEGLCSMKIRVGGDKEGVSYGDACIIFSQEKLDQILDYYRYAKEHGHNINITYKETKKKPMSKGQKVAISIFAGVAAVAIVFGAVVFGLAILVVGGPLFLGLWGKRS